MSPCVIAQREGGAAGGDGAGGEAAVASPDWFERTSCSAWPGLRVPPPEPSGDFVEPAASPPGQRTFRNTGRTRRQCEVDQSGSS